MEVLADRILEFDLGIIENTAVRFPGLIHGLTFTDDWGTQQNLFISPDLWRSFFRPRYQRLFDAAHRQGRHAWMHACGKVNAIIGDLIDIGLDVINLQQPRALGIEETGERFQGRICFASACDIQRTLPFRSVEEIRQEAHLLLERWATPDGGFIVSDYGDNNAIGADPGKKQAMLEAFLECRCPARSAGLTRSEAAAAVSIRCSLLMATGRPSVVGCR